MEAQTWTVIGLLAATLLGTLIYIGGRIDGISARIDSQSAQLNARIDGLSSEMNARFDGLSTRIDGLSTRVDALTAEMHEHMRWHAG
jgi:outer membrane murein-binding lipoprotein Lpp